MTTIRPSKDPSTASAVVSPGPAGLSLVSVATRAPGVPQDLAWADTAEALSFVSAGDHSA